MKLKLVALSEEAFIDGCIEAILQNDVSHTHVLARNGEQFLYFITAGHCTFSTVIPSKKTLEIECIFDKEGILIFHEEFDNPKELTESFTDFVEAMKGAGAFIL